MNTSNKNQHVNLVISTIHLVLFGPTTYHSAINLGNAPLVKAKVTSSFCYVAAVNIVGMYVPTI